MELQQPLDSAAPPISRGLIFLTLVAILSIWANYEASKGFEISVVNDAGNDTPLGRHLSLFFISNDEAIRIVLRTTQLSHQLLYPNKTHHHHHPIKPVRRITVRLSAARNLSHHLPEIITEKKTNDEYVVVVHVGESVVLERYENFNNMIGKAIERGVARVWVWDGKGGAPAEIVEGVAELVVAMGGQWGRGSEWDEWGEVGEFLRCCEGLKKGFIGRLNQAMEEDWEDQMVDDALGMPAQQLCGSYRYSFSSWGVGKVGHVDDGILASL